MNLLEYMMTCFTEYVVHCLSTEEEVFDSLLDDDTVDQKLTVICYLLKIIEKKNDQELTSKALQIIFGSDLTFIANAKEEDLMGMTVTQIAPSAAKLHVITKMFEL